jgi:hypothetical protein
VRRYAGYLYQMRFAFVDYKSLLVRAYLACFTTWLSTDASLEASFHSSEGTGGTGRVALLLPSCCCHPVLASTRTHLILQFGHTMRSRKHPSLPLQHKVDETEEAMRTCAEGGNWQCIAWDEVGINPVSSERSTCRIVIEHIKLSFKQYCWRKCWQ